MQMRHQAFRQSRPKTGNFLDANDRLLTLFAAASPQGPLSEESATIAAHPLPNSKS